MQRKSFGRMVCPIARSLERVGEWWSILILRDALYGMTRFDQVQKSLGIAPNMLARRLNALVDACLLERRRYSEHPPRDEYVLTARGRDFRPVLVALLAWGNRHFAPEGASVLLVDAKTGAAVDPILVDRASGRPIKEPDFAFAAGPAASRASDEGKQPTILRDYGTAKAARQRNAHDERRRNRAGPGRPAGEAGRCASPEVQPADARAAARTHRSHVVVDGLAERPRDVRASGERLDRDLVRGEARHRCAGGHGARFPGRDADADDLRRRHGRRHFFCDRASAGRRPAR